MSVVIRRINGPAHAAELYDMQAQCLPDDAPCSVEVGDWWIGYDDDEPAAFACLSQSKRFENCGYLARAGVLPAHRGNGIQKRLIRVRLREAQKHRYHTVFTDTTDNPASSNALIGCGFKIYQPVEPYGPAKHTVYFRLLMPNVVVR